MKQFLLFIFCTVCLTAGISQDIHFSQYYNSPLNINPALTGIFEQDVRLIANYRSQWTAVPVPFQTISGSFDMKYFHKKFANGYFGGGIIFNHDQAGDSELSISQLNLSGSYTQILNDNLLMTAGFQMGPGQRAFKLDRLEWKNQFQGDIVDLTRPSGEQFQNTSIGFIDLSAGLNLFFRNYDENVWVNAGMAMFHINKPQQNFTGQVEQRLPSRYSIYSFGNIQLNTKMQWVVHAMGQLQNAYNEIVLGTGIHYQLNDEPSKELGIRLLTTYRYSNLNDAVVPMMEIHYLVWRLGLSYDINVSDFKVATNGRGGPEISLQYVISKVKPPDEFKVCPIF